MQYLVALEHPWPTRSPAAASSGPGLPGTRDPGRVPGAVPGRPGAPLANPITGGLPQGGRAFLVLEIPGGCPVQYLVALERPWPPRSPAAAPRGAWPAWYP
ncbi:hypothetical protein [Aeromonas caviae]|uniref:hypothetical protein n=1 Tax=Aeromonas caviae TaxID=648 RepID=UPI0030DC5C95